MANTYSQLYVQIVFAVKGRRRLISPKFREELQKYITGIITNRKQKLLAIYCMPDHVHILVGLKPAIALSDLVRDIKAGSSGFISERGWVQGKFQWQEGYGAFSYSHSHLNSVIDYINNQEIHHRRKTFREEYIDTLKQFNIEYDNQYLFDWID